MSRSSIVIPGDSEVMSVTSIGVLMMLFSFTVATEVRDPRPVATD